MTKSLGTQNALKIGTNGPQQKELKQSWGPNMLENWKACMALEKPTSFI